MLRFTRKTARVGSILATAALAATAFLGGAGPASAATAQPNGQAATRLTVAAGGTQLAALTSGSHYQNANSGKCLVVQGTVNGTGAFQYDCLGFADQLWTLVANASGTSFQLQNSNSGKCLVVQGTANGTAAFQYDCLGYADQFWNVIADMGGHVQFQNVNSGKCLVIQGTTDGNTAFQYDCGSNWADQWWTAY